MDRLNFVRFVSFTSTLLASVACTPHEHSADTHEHAEEALEHDPTSVTVFGERVLLFMEYPHLVRGTPTRFLAHFTVLETGEPVRSGSVTLEIGATRLAVDAPKRDGLFIPEGALPEAGKFAARVIVKSDRAEETFDLGEIVVHATDAEADAAAHAAVGEEPANAVPFLLEPQWKVKLLLAEAEGRTLSRRLIVPARAVTPEGMSATVAAPAAGRLMAPPSGAQPTTGQRIEAGQTLALVEPPLGAADLAQLHTLELEMHALELELDLKALEGQRAMGEAQARLEFAERERARVATLRAEGLSTVPQLEQAEQSIALARAELDAAARTKASIDRLVERRGAVAGKPGSAVRFELRAPIGGVLVESRAAAGSSVAAGEAVFRVLDTSRVWIEGHVSEFDLGQLGEAPRAVAEFAAFPARRFELHGPGRGLPYIGREVDDSSRTLLVRYEIDNADGALRAGMLAELFISTGEHAASVAVPLEGVIMDQGIPTAYVMLEGKLFQRRELELGVRDGAWVEVKSGIQRGERIATRGAYVVKLAALSPASFGAGHAH